LELVEGLRDFPDFLLIQASITRSAHSLLFFGSLSTRRSNSFQSSMVYSSTIQLSRTWTDISTPMSEIASLRADRIPPSSQGLVEELGPGDRLDMDFPALLRSRRPLASGMIVPAAVFGERFWLPLRLLGAQVTRQSWRFALPDLFQRGSSTGPLGHRRPGRAQRGGGPQRRRPRGSAATCRCLCGW
jgi:hypothetical protein